MNSIFLNTKIIFPIFIVVLLYLQVDAQSNIIPNSSQEDTEPARNIIESDEDHLIMEYLFNGISISERNIEGRTYQFVHIDGFEKMIDIGKPALPSHTDIIALPKGQDVEIEIIESEFQEYANYLIHPVLAPASDEVGAPEPTFILDEKQYNTNEYYPSSLISIMDIQKIRDLPLAMLNIRPVQYNPVTKTLRVYSKIKYELHFMGSKSNTDQFIANSSDRFIQFASNSVLNNNVLLNSTVKKTASSSTDYIIITHPDLQMAADTLAKWKMQLGYEVEILSKSNWTTSQIKDSIEVKYNNSNPHPDYVVFLGDVDRVPGEIIDGTFSCDLYYVCMDGPTDFFADIAGGRISVSSAAEASEVVQKIVKYESKPVADPLFYNDGLNCAQFQDYDSDTYADRRFSLTSENIYDYMTGSQFKTVNRVYVSGASNTPTYWNDGYYAGGEPLPSYLLKPGFAWDGDATDIISEINAGKFFVLHRDHGYTGGWGDPAFSISDIPSLVNGDKLPVMFSINCSSGNFRSTSFAEVMLRRSGGGAVGVFAASEVSYSGYNDAMAIGFFDAIWSSPGIAPNFTGSGWISNPSLTPHADIRNMGFVLMQGLIRMTESWGTFQTSNELFHYHGDPAMQIWTESPLASIATHSDSVICNSTSFTVTGANNANGMATLYHNGELIASTQLNSGSGMLTFDPITNIKPNMTLTISGNGYAPYAASIDIRQCTFSPVAEFFYSDSSVTLCGLASESIIFTDASIFSPDTWQWIIIPSTVNFINGTSSTSQYPEVEFTASGTYSIQLVASNVFGSDTIAFVDVIEVNSGRMLPTVEEFEANAFPPEGWSISNNDGGATWEAAGVVGNALSSRSAKIGYFSYQTIGEKDGLITPVMDLLSSPDAVLDFDVAYSRFSGYVDTLAIYVSTDCGNSYDPIPVYEKYGAALETSTVSGSFTPQSYSEWRKESVDLSAYIGNQVVIKFEGTCGYGNNLYLDNINVYSSDLFPVVRFTTSDTLLSCNGTSTIVEFTDLSYNNPTSFTWSFSPNMVSFAGGTNANSQHPQVLFLNYGVYDVTLVVDNSAGNEFLSKAAYVNIEPPESTPFVEGFENFVVPPQRWQLNNFDGDKTWNVNFDAVGNGLSSASAYIYNYAYYAPGEIDELISPPVDLTGMTNSVLNFNVAYQVFSGYSDSLKIFVSTDCGNTYDSVPIYSKGGTTLETSSGSGASFTPSVASDWRQEVVSLDNYIGSSIVLKFQAINDYGNNLFLDDINIGNIGIAPVASISSSLTNWLHCGGVNSVVNFSDSSSENPTAWNWSFNPNTVSYMNGSTSSDSNIDVLFNTLGVYQLELNVSNSFGSDVISQFIIVDSVVSDFIKPADTIYTGSSFSFFNNSFGADTWSWYFGDGGGSILEHATHIYSDTGTYPITLYAENSATGCNSTSNQNIVVIGIPTTGIIDFDQLGKLLVGPIPSTGMISIEHDFSTSKTIALSVYNTIGQSLHQESFYAVKMGAHQLNLSHLEDGVYFMKFSIHSVVNAEEVPITKTVKLLFK